MPSDPGSLQFRLAFAEDAPAIAALVNSAYRGDGSKAGWTTEADLIGGLRTEASRIATLIESPDSAFIVAEAVDGLRGCVCMERKPGWIYFGMLTVRPGMQARGLGRELLERVEAFATGTWGLREARMCVFRQRKELIAWYERRGFRPTGETAPYEPAPYEEPRCESLEFIVMKKSLVSPQK